MLPAVDVSTRGAKRDPNLKLTSADLCLQALNDYHTRSAEAGTECEQATWVFDVSKLTIKQVGDCFFCFVFVAHTCDAYLPRVQIVRCTAAQHSALRVRMRVTLFGDGAMSLTARRRMGTMSGCAHDTSRRVPRFCVFSPASCT